MIGAVFLLGTVDLRIAGGLVLWIIGYGFMGRAHSNAFRQANRFFDLEHELVLKAASARNEERLQTFCESAGWEEAEPDWRKLVERDDIDIIDIATSPLMLLLLFLLLKPAYLSCMSDGLYISSDAPPAIIAFYRVQVAGEAG